MTARSLCVLLALASPALAQDTQTAPPEGEPVHLAWKLEAGQQLTYSVSMISNANGAMQSAMEASMVFTVFVLRDGAALVETRLEALTGMMGGQPIPPQAIGTMRPGFEVQTVLTPEGFDPQRTLTPKQRNLFAMCFPLPTAPLRVGESWVLDMNLVQAGPGASGRENSVGELVALEQDGDAQLARLRVTSEGSVGIDEGPEGGLGVSMTVEGEGLFDVTAGHLRTNDMTATSTMNDPRGETIEMSNQVVVQLDSVGQIAEADQAEKAKRLAELLPE